jgi:hypothetical protein
MPTHKTEKIMVKKISGDTKIYNFRLDVNLVTNIDNFCKSTGITRASAVNLMLTAGLGLLQSVVFPQQTLSNPEAAQYVAGAIDRATTTIDRELDDAEKSKQSPKTEG